MRKRINFTDWLEPKKIYSEFTLKFTPNLLSPALAEHVFLNRRLHRLRWFLANYINRLSRIINAQAHEFSQIGWNQKKFTHNLL